jgi:serpin B
MADDIEGRRRRPLGRRGGVAVGAVVVLAAAVTTTGVLATGSGPGGPAHRPVATGPGVRIGTRLDGAVQLVSRSTPAARTDPAATSRVAMAEQALSVALLKSMRGSSNASISPLSLYVALGMLQDGARGTTATQIADALQARGATAAEQNTGLAGLMASLTATAAGDGITLDSADSLWQQTGFPLRADFLAALAAYYRAGVWQVDYASDLTGALKAIDAWTARQTHGKITKLFDHLDPRTVLVLANAVYFHAAWATPFDTAKTGPGRFTTGSGRQVTAQFMTGGAGLSAVTTSTYDAVQLPYRGDRFTALAIMPRSATLGRFVGSLTPRTIAGIASSLRSGSSVTLPRFTTTSTTDLGKTLQELGLRDAFTPRADLSGLSPRASQVSQVIQRVYLGVGEKGTTAAAATGIGITTSAGFGGPQITFDHPFLLLIRDTKTGAILFATEMQDPTAG